MDKSKFSEKSFVLIFGLVARSIQSDHVRVYVSHQGIVPEVEVCLSLRNVIVNCEVHEMIWLTYLLYVDRRLRPETILRSGQLYGWTLDWPSLLSEWVLNLHVDHTIGIHVNQAMLNGWILLRYLH